MGRFPIPICYLGLQQGYVARVTMEMGLKSSWVCPVLFQPEKAGWTLAGHGKLEILKSRVGPIKSSLRGWGKKSLWVKRTYGRKGNHLPGREKFYIRMNLFKSEFLFFT